MKNMFSKVIISRMIVEHFNISNPFEPIFKPIIGIASSFLKIGEFLLEFRKLFIDGLSAVSSIFNPAKLINDIIIGLILGIQELFNGLLNKFNLSYFYNENKDTKSNKNNKNNKNKKCYKLSFLRIIALILCPPLAIFADKGIQSFFQIIICSILTIYGYYFPGLIYAILHIQC